MNQQQQHQGPDPMISFMRMFMVVFFFYCLPGTFLGAIFYRLIRSKDNQVYYWAGAILIGGALSAYLYLYQGMGVSAFNLSVVTLQDVEYLRFQPLHLLPYALACWERTIGFAPFIAGGILLFNPKSAQHMVKEEVNSTRRIREKAADKARRQIHRAPDALKGKIVLGSTIPEEGK